MRMMPNGDVIPSHVGVKSTPEYDPGDAFTNMTMRFGEVQEIIYPDDDRSRTKKFMEYRVYVQERSGGTGNGRMYEGVLLMNSLGSIADKCIYTLRPSKSAAQNKDNRLGYGSKVLLLCINGETNNAVIIGGLRDEKDNTEEKTKSKDLGHHFFWVFNGLSAYIDKEGQLLVQYGGKTDIDGKRNSDVEKKNVGTRMVFAKNGSWNLNTPDPDDSSKKDQYILMEHGDERRTIHQAQKLWQCVVKQGKAKFEADDGVHLNDATDLMLLGESYRNAQKEMHNQLKNFLQQAAAQLSAAVSTAPGAALPQVQAAGQLLLQAANTIETFESKAEAKNGFLSKKHKND